MKHFLIEIIYTAPIKRIEEIVGEHRAYVQTGFDAGMLLCSGPMNPRTGGIVIARANDVSEIESFFAQDPYQLLNAAEYRIVEFLPLKHQPFLADWIQP